MLSALLLLLCAALAAAPAVGDATIFSDLPAGPGYPEDVCIYGDHVFVTMPAADHTAGSGPSPVLVLDRKTGAYITSIVVDGEDTGAEHALVGCAIGPDDNLYVLSTQLGVLQFSPDGDGGWGQVDYSGPFAQIGPIPANIPNGLAFTPSGDLLVSDSLQNVIWKVPAGGGTPSVWFALPYPPFFLGLNGLKLDPDREHVYVTYTGFPGAEDGHLYRLPLAASPTLADLETLLTYTGGEMPDGLTFERRGALWMTLSGADAVVKVEHLDTAPAETLWITGPSGTSVDFFQPANMAFDARRPGYMLVVNHALYSTDPADFVVFDVFVGHGIVGDRLP